jgi:hypothetical protein
MHRWWDDPDTALAILDGLAPSPDVTQGVGTAVLGHHALVRAALVPLSTSTLVDPADLSAAAAAVDTAPLAKALSAATEVVMGSAADRYGQLLAEHLHADAVAGVEHAVRTLSAAGVPMPLAVERTADVAGLPPRWTGTYLQAVKGPSVPPLVRQDAADRALMVYAARVGRREHTEPVDGVVQKAVQFREHEHRRDTDGKFTTKGQGPERQDRLARRQRRLRLERTRSLVEQTTADPAHQTGLQGLSRLFARPAQQTQDPAQPPAGRERAAERAGRARTGRAQPGRAEPQQQTSTFTAPLDANPETMYTHTTRSGQAMVTWVDQGVLEQLILEGGDFNMGRLEQAQGHALTAYREDSPSLWSIYQGNAFGPRKVAVRLSGSLPVRDGGPDDPSGMEIAQEATFSPSSYVKGDLTLYGGGGKYGDSVAVDVYDFTANGTVSALAKASERWQTDAGVVTRDVARDAAGRFSDVDERRARRERRGRQARRTQQSADTPPATPPLQGLSRLFAQPAQSTPASQEQPGRARGRSRGAERGRRRAGREQVRQAMQTGGSVAGLAADEKQRIADFKANATALTIRQSDLERSLGFSMMDLADGGVVSTVEDPDFAHPLTWAKVSTADATVKDYVHSGEKRETMGSFSAWEYDMAERELERARASSDAGLHPNEITWRFALEPSANLDDGWDLVRVDYQLDDPQVLVVGEDGGIETLQRGGDVEYDFYPPTEGMEALRAMYGLPADYFDAQAPIAVLFARSLDA